MSDLGLEARALLDAGRTALKPKEEDRKRIALLLGSRLGVPVSPQDAHSPPAAPPPTASGTLGWPTLSAAVTGIIVSAGVAVYALRTPEPTPLAQPVVETSTVAAVPPPVATSAEAAPTLEPLPPVEPPAAQVARRPSDRLAEEVAILSRAETELHAGRYQGALAVLAEHERKFPRGTLAPERRAARIRALCGLGRGEEANALLARLSPGSVHEERTREACAATSKK